MGIPSTKTNITNERLYIGYKSHGWTLIKMYRRFNLWEREARYYDGVSARIHMIRECFYRNEVPNEYSMLRYAD